MSTVFRRPKRPSHGIDMAPLIDVVFLLLVFFMLTSTFSPPSLPLALPRSAEPGESSSPSPTLSIAADGTLALDGELLEIENLASLLSRRFETAETRSIQLRGDRSLDYGKILDVMNRARAAGAAQIQLVYESEP